MAQTNYTPISLYYSTTASAVPTAANLVPGELAINTADGKLYYEDSSGVVQVLATKSTGSIGGSNTQVQFNNNGSLGGSSGLTWDGSFLTTSSIKNSALTSGRVTYAGASGLLSDSANLTWDNTNARLGIGTSSSVTTLQVGSYVTNAGSIAIASTTTGAGSIFFGDGPTGSDFYRGYIQYEQTNDAFLFATSTIERMRITSAGNVGIGTSSPQRTLSIANGGPTVEIDPNGGTAGPIYFNYNRSTATYITPEYWALAHNWRVSGGTSAMTLDSSGNLGLGVTPSASSGSYRNLQNGGALLMGASGTADIYLNANAFYDGAWKYISTGVAARYSMNGSVNGHSWDVAVSGSAGTAVTWLEKMRLDSSGNLLVGTTTPIFNASGRGLITINGSSAAAVGFTASGVDKGIILHTGTDMIMSNSVAGAITFQTNNTERMRILANGSVCVNTTVAEVDATSKLIVTTTTASGVAAEFSNNTSGTSCVAINNSGAATANLVSWYAANAFRASITWNGTLIVYGTSSDVRLKENITDSGSGLAKLSNVKIRSFDWKESGIHTDFGVVAQELQAVAPEAVIVGKDNEDGSIKESWSVDSSVLVPAMIKAIQEQQALIESLTTRLTALESK